MSYIVNRSTLAVVIALAALILISGCSSNPENPRKKANEAVAQANESVAQHNKLFEQSRSTYDQVRAELESGKDPSGQKAKITDAKNALDKAGNNLKDARESLKKIQGMDVDKAVKKYTSLLSSAMGDQISAEDKEAEFYSILEKDPTLKDNRKEAENLLSEVGKSYGKSREAYKKARDFAKSNPNVITLPPNATGGASTEVFTGGSSTMPAPSTTSTTVGGTT